jgi:aminoglycoside phosphotransferase family enzyme/predicted kinase
MNATELQEVVFAHLMNPDTHGGLRVERIDTHAASVFLAGEHAYKVKRAVKYPYLDYSTLEKRKAACAKELEINRRFAADLYLKVIPITQEPGGKLALDGDGEPIEWAVVMKRFDERKTLDHLAESASITEELAEQLGRRVAELHTEAPTLSADAWLKFLPEIIADNDAALRQRADLFTTADVDFLRDQSNSALNRITPLLESRGRSGFIRQGHGDLHLGNIALIGGQPIAFDAIEFDPLIAAGDVLYDLAFLLMDLIDRGLPAIANIVLNRYLVATRRDENLDGMAALPLFLSLRAAIRAKVALARLVRTTSKDRSATADQARTYFDLAVGFLSPAKPRLVAVGGLSGTGKSALARAVAPKIMPAPGAIILRSDIERKIMFGVPENKPLPQDAYAPAVGVRVYEILGRKAQRVIAAGHSAIVDAVFASTEERRAIRAIADDCGVEFIGLFLEADLRTRLDRVMARVNDASDADAAIAARQQEIEIGPLDWQRIDAAHDKNDTASQALRAIET